ncbi:hypothetical protein [Parasitella parasitica]|uniref:Uncharacterized protein n=1 Tax=Parasitella parasitica TaxID=35722 RepID=A0A0B7N2U2_9FUNG|nr:hypothetical protein [Parasitella parasitica]
MHNPAIIQVKYGLHWVEDENRWDIHKNTLDQGSPYWWNEVESYWTKHMCFENPESAIKESFFEKSLRFWEYRLQCFYIKLPQPGAFKINEIADIPTPIRELSNYTRRHYQKKKIIVRFDHYLSISKNAYQLDKAKRDAVNSLLEENYRMHGSLADRILEAVGASGYKKNDANDSDDSCTS